MALSRRAVREPAPIWPGFVDAMTGLLLVLVFVLTIFMGVQSVLRETISGQESQLDAFSDEVAALSRALGLEQRRAGDLEDRLGELSATLARAQGQAAEQATLIATLRGEGAAQAAALDSATAQITNFEAQVAALIAERAVLQGDVAAATELAGDLRARIAEVEDSRDAAQLEADARAEALRLAEAKRAALEAMAAELRADLAAGEAELAAQQTELTAATSKLEAEEGARLAEAAAAQRLRERLENADAELTAMTLALENQRAKAEETLTLLAAAEAARDALEEAQTSELTDAERRAGLLAAANAALSDEREKSAEAQRQQALLNQQVAALRGQLSSLQALLDDAKSRDAAAQVQLQSLGSDLNAALARVAAEERKRAELEAAERKRLEAETRDLAKYRSEFFGRMREVLGAQEGVKIVGDRFVFSSEVLFPPGAAELSAQGQREIAKVARILRNVAGDIPSGIDWVIRVDGHTDNVPLSGTGEFADNWELSQARALSVVRYMSGDLGIAPDRLSANGFGEFQPVNRANTPAARAQNRRIELKLTEK